MKSVVLDVIFDDLTILRGAWVTKIIGLHGLNWTSVPLLELL
jgi:hypothetical protein